NHLIEQSRAQLAFGARMPRVAASAEKATQCSPNAAARRQQRIVRSRHGPLSAHSAPPHGWLRAWGLANGGHQAMSQEMRISGPHTHENLVLFFLHGPSQPGPVPLTLEEALAKGNVHLKETGLVSELSIENTGDQEVFIQSGDIVKGGRQDRVL